MSLRSDIMRISVLGFRSDLRIELQAPVVISNLFWSTLVDSYLPQVNTYPNKINGARRDGELVSLGPNKHFQTLIHHNLLSALRLGSDQPVQRSYAYGAAVWELVQSYIIITFPSFSIYCQTLFFVHSVFRMKAYK